MTQQNVSDTLKKVYPRFVSFRYIVEQNPDVSETTLHFIHWFHKTLTLYAV